MIRSALICAALALTACQAKTQEPQIEPAPAMDEEPAVQQAKVQQIKLDPPSASQSPAPILVADTPYGEPKLTRDLDCTGVMKQGGALMCRTSPNAIVTLGRSETQADEKGRVILGFDRDAPALAQVKITHADGGQTTHKLPIEAQEYSISRIDGLPPSQVSTFTDEQLKRIRSSTARKSVGFKSQIEDIYFQDGFVMPIEGRKSSPFGAQRILNGEAKRPHYGVDIAAPVGTPIYAPAGGVVSLADDDLYFEGAMVMIDHGQGLNSMYLHVSEIFVTPGQVVQAGDKIAAVGSKGRSTGPHLCWRLKWRKENLDPELLTAWPG